MLPMIAVITPQKPLQTFGCNVMMILDKEAIQVKRIWPEKRDLGVGKTIRWLGGQHRQGEPLFILPRREDGSADGINDT